MQKVQLGIIFSIVAIGVVGVSALTFTTALESQTSTMINTDTIEITDSASLVQTGTDNGKMKIGGWFLIEHYDKDHNLISTESIYNRVVDTGEDFINDQVFEDSVTSADNAQIGSICIGDQATVVVAEAEAASDFDGDNGITENNCKEDNTVTTATSTAVIGPLTFTCGGTNCADNDTITGIAICQNDVTDNTDFNNCATEGIMFSVVDISDVTLAASETVDITYTFDITSPSD